MPTGQKLSKEDKAETRFRPKVLLLPNKDNEVTSETMAYGPNGVESNNLTLSVFGELQKGDNVSDEDFEKQKQNSFNFFLLFFTLTNTYVLEQDFIHLNCHYAEQYNLLFWIFFVGHPQCTSTLKKVKVFVS